MQKNRIALIPAYEPDQHMIALLQDLLQAGFISLVVDDGSGEAYADLFRQAETFADVLHHPVNCGKGGALKTGFSYIQKTFGTNCIIVTLDADGQHTAADATKVCQYAEEHPDSLILGSRQLKESVPLRSRFGNSITRHVYAASTGLRVHDTQTGLRAFHVGLLPQFLEISGERYEYEMNVLLECTRRNIPIREVPIATIYFDQNAASHFDTIKDSYRVYREILRFSASSLISFLIDYGLYIVFSLLTTHVGFSGNVWISNISARVISAGANYTLNRKIVFHSKARLAKSAGQYFALAALILAGNTLVLSLLVDICGWNRYLSKICTEMLFFLLSWIVQRSLIFKNRNER